MTHQRSQGVTHGTLWTVALIAHDLLKLLGVIPDRWSDKWGY